MSGTLPEAAVLSKPEFRPRATQDHTLSRFDERMMCHLADAPPAGEGTATAMVEVMHDHMTQRAAEIGAYMAMVTDDVMAGRAGVTRAAKLAGSAQAAAERALVASR